MKRKPDWLDKRQSLRRTAEGILSPLSPGSEASLPAEVLMHELLVHKVELEMQVEELRRAHDAMEAARDRYVEFYDFAPVGYVTLNREGMIGEINLTGAALLGMDRIQLVNRRFSTFVSNQDRDLWHRLFMNMMTHADADKQAFVLELMRADATPFHAYLDCRLRQAMDAQPTLRLALFDIGRIKQAEVETGNAAGRSEGFKV